MVEEPRTSGQRNGSGRLTRRRAALVVVLVYAAAALSIKGFLASVESFHGVDDARNDQMTLLLSVFISVFAARALFTILRRPRAPGS